MIEKSNMKTIALRYKPKYINFQPCYATLCSAGVDVAADIQEPMVLQKGAVVKIPTGCYLDASENKYTKFVAVLPKSSTVFKHGVLVVTGTVDLDYVEEIQVVCIAMENTTIMPGAKLAQLVALPFDYLVGDCFIKNVERTGGFGSTDK